MDFLKYKNMGISGLANLGNTCFVNSCIQIIFHTYELCEYFEKIELADDDNDILIKELFALKDVLWSKRCIVSPNRFIQVLHEISSRKGNIFDDYSQNDASEFLLFLLETMHECFPKIQKKEIVTDKKDILSVCNNHFNMLLNSGQFSMINNLFYGVKVTILNTKVVTIKPEDFFILHLPIPSNEPAIEECIEMYLSDEILEGENGIINPETNEKESVLKQTMFWRLPKILVVDFQRFKMTTTLRKKQNMIHFGQNLNMTKYVMSGNYNYELYGVMNHSGGVQGGHYTSLIKNQNGKWYHYNDTNIKEVSNNEICTPKAYCLFYRKM